MENEIIILETGERLFNSFNLTVFEGGEFKPQDLVIVISDGDEIPHYQYQANFIKYGQII